MQSRSSYPKSPNTQPLNRRHNSASDRGATRPTSNLEPGTRLHADRDRGLGQRLTVNKETNHE